MLAIAQRPSPNHNPRPDGAPIDLIILHATVGSFDSALHWMQNPAPEGNPDHAVSSHYEVREDGFIAQLVDESQAAWHAGVSSWRGRTGLNRYSIGIEIANPNDGKTPYPEVQYAAVVALVKDIVRRRGITPDNITTHAAVAPGRKTDPLGFLLARLKADVFATAPLVVPAAPVTVYAVVGDVVNVRSKPGVTDAAITHQYHQGAWTWIASIDHGERITLNGVSSDQWAHMATTATQPALGWIWLPLLRTLEQPPVPTWIPDEQAIIGSPFCGRAVLDRTLLQHCPHLTPIARDQIADAIADVSQRATIGDIFILAQWAKETQWGTARRWVMHFNPSGLGATNDGAEGAIFANPQEGFEAMVGHLLNYAAQWRDLNEQQRALAAKDPRRAAVEAMGNIGKAPRWIDLSQKWGVLLEGVPVPPITDPQAYGMSIIVRVRSLV